MPTPRLPFLAAFVLALACGGSGENPYQVTKQTKGLSDLKQAAPELSAEEAEAKRKELGIRTDEEIAAENAAMFEKGAREYIKTRAGEYREFIQEFRKRLDTIEKEAPKWAEAKDPAQAFEKFLEPHKEWSKAFTRRYDELTGHGAEGGNTQAALGKAFRQWEEIDQNLGPELGKDPQFAAALTGVRDALAEVEKVVGEIEKDESLKVDETYKRKPARDDE
jgi:hypothetical protein